jgi:hypothetical protein
LGKLMAEQDWYGPFGNGGWKPISTAVIGLIVGVEALIGYTFERKVWLVGEPEPPTEYLDHPNWPFLFVGLAIIAYAAREWWQLRQRR